MSDDLTERARVEARQRLDSRWSSDPHPDLTGMPEGEGRAYIFGFAQGAAWAAEQSAAHDGQVRREAKAISGEALVDLYWHTSGDDWAIPDWLMVKYARAVLDAASIARYGGAR